MMLTIKIFNELDAGIYTCISSNTLGRANSTIRIYGENFFSFKFLDSLDVEQEKLKYLLFIYSFAEVKVPTTEPTTIPTTTPSTTTTRRTTRGKYLCICILYIFYLSIEGMVVWILIKDTCSLKIQGSLSRSVNDFSSGCSTCDFSKPPTQPPF